jgi:hypothetical protein
MDEVKVVGKILRNSKNGHMCGIAMDSEDMQSLREIYIR